MNPVCPCCKGTGKHRLYSYNRDSHVFNITCGDCYGNGHLPTRFDTYIAAADGNVYSEGPVPWKALHDFLEMMQMTELDKPVVEA